jgi:hypothetical protein
LLQPTVAMNAFAPRLRSECDHLAVEPGAAMSFGNLTPRFHASSKDAIVTFAHHHSLAIILCAALTACSGLPTASHPPELPAGVFGVYEDNDIGALNQSAWAFADPARTQNDPIDAARAVIAVEYLADALRSNPRWQGLSGAGMLQARVETRRVLGIVPDAPPQPVVEALLRLIAALRSGDPGAPAQALSSPVFTLPSSETLQILSHMPYIPATNIATLQASNGALVMDR